MRFIIDVQMPGALVRDIRRRGHEAHRVVDLIVSTSSDFLIVTFASARDAVVMTKDEDFVRLSARSPQPVVIVWFRCGNISNDNLLALIDRTFDGIIAAIERGERLIEIR